MASPPWPSQGDDDGDADEAHYGPLIDHHDCGPTESSTDASILVAQHEGPSESSTDGDVPWNTGSGRDEAALQDPPDETLETYSYIGAEAPSRLPSDSPEVRAAVVRGSKIVGLDRPACEMMLKAYQEAAPGCFMVRESAKDAGAVVLSMIDDLGVVVHVKLVFSAGAENGPCVSLASAEASFRTLQELKEFYRVGSAQGGILPCCLTKEVDPKDLTLGASFLALPGEAVGKNKGKSLKKKMISWTRKKGKKSPSEKLPTGRMSLSPFSRRKTKADAESGRRSLPATLDSPGGAADDGDGDQEGPQNYASFGLSAHNADFVPAKTHKAGEPTPEATEAAGAAAGGDTAETTGTPPSFRTGRASQRVSNKARTGRAAMLASMSFGDIREQQTDGDGDDSSAEDLGGGSDEEEEENDDDDDDYGELFAMQPPAPPAPAGAVVAVVARASVPGYVNVQAGAQNQGGSGSEGEGEGEGEGAGEGKTSYDHAPDDEGGVDGDGGCDDDGIYGTLSHSNATASSGAPAPPTVHVQTPPELPAEPAAAGGTALVLVQEEPYFDADDIAAGGTARAAETETETGGEPAVEHDGYGPAEGGDEIYGTMEHNYDDGGAQVPPPASPTTATATASSSGGTTRPLPSSSPAMPRAAASSYDGAHGSGGSGSTTDGPIYQNTQSMPGVASAGVGSAVAAAGAGGSCTEQDGYGDEGEDDELYETYEDAMKRRASGLDSGAAGEVRRAPAPALGVVAADDDGGLEYEVPNDELGRNGERPPPVASRSAANAKPRAAAPVRAPGIDGMDSSDGDGDDDDDYELPGELAALPRAPAQAEDEDYDMPDLERPVQRRHRDTLGQIVPLVPARASREAGGGPTRYDHESESESELESAGGGGGEGDYVDPAGDRVAAGQGHGPLPPTPPHGDDLSRRALPALPGSAARPLPPVPLASGGGQRPLPARPLLAAASLPPRASEPVLPPAAGSMLPGLRIKLDRKNTAQYDQERIARIKARQARHAQLARGNAGASSLEESSSDNVPAAGTAGTAAEAAEAEAARRRKSSEEGFAF